MAKSKRNNVVLLGFEDEAIREKQKSISGYWSNKVGGHPDWPIDGINKPNCKLCGLIQPLVVQIYAPLENSSFHRTLYVFACINPNCWNHSESWTCIRSQLLDTDILDVPEKVNASSCTDWCTDADDWNDNNGNYENGNTTKPVNQYSPSDGESDDDSCSLSAMIGKINVDECNANCDSKEKGSGAVGKQILPSATAEIEKEESEVVCIDTPTVPQKDLLALLHETAPVPYFMRAGKTNHDCVAFNSFFISVGEEGIAYNNSEHIRELIQEYQRTHGDMPKLSSSGSLDQHKCSDDLEEYEIGIPAHGDKVFHRFLSRIQNNPEQILRYSRESECPLLIYPLTQYPGKCMYCNGETIFEMQLLPTLIPKLRFPAEDEIRVEFGTVLIFTCKNSCWTMSDKFKEEPIILQIEKL